MKKTFFFILIFWCIQTISFGQFNFGLKAGLNYTTLSENEVTLQINNETADFYNYRVGYHTGIFGEYTIGDKFGIRTELLYSLQGAKNNYTEGTQDFEYLNLPIVLAFMPIEEWNIKVLLGGQIGYLLSEDLDLLGADNEIDLAALAGIQWNFGEHLGASFRYIYAYNSVLEINYTDINGNDIGTQKHKNRVFQLSLEYRLKK